MNDKQTTIQEIKDKVRKFRSDRGWLMTDPKDMALSIVLEAAEVLEHFQWVKTEEVINNKKWKQAIGEEISDVLYLISELATELNIDIADSFEKKMEKQANKYPLDKFNPDMNKKQRMGNYYKVKAETRGGHPLADEE